jgi:hypothetical protein
MKNRNILFGVIFLVVYFISIDCSYCQRQRMGIPAGSFHLSPSGTEKISTYCMDFTREAPSEGIIYEKILTSPENTIVKIGDKQKTLQEAIDAKEVSIDGVSFSLPDLIIEMQRPAVLSRMSPEERVDIKEFINLYKTATPREKKLLEAEVKSIFTEGDHTHMNLVNHTPYNVDVVFAQNTIVGQTKAENIGYLDCNSIMRGKPSSVQPQIWQQHLMLHQRFLKDLGYYNGELDGRLGPQTKAAIKKFKEENNIIYNESTIKEIDAETEKKLIKQHDKWEETTFENRQYEEKKSIDTMTLFRYYGEDGNPISCFLTNTGSLSASQAAIDLALPPTNKACSLSIFKIPPGVTYKEGKIAGGYWYSKNGKYEFIPEGDNVKLEQLRQQGVNLQRQKGGGIQYIIQNVNTSWNISKQLNPNK